MQVAIVNKSINELPSYSTPGAAGMDLRANFTNGNLKDDFLFFAEWDEVGEYLIIFSGGRALVPTDLFVQVPDGYELQIRPRSGLALKEGITVLNTPGTIDSDYTGNVGVILINFNEEPFIVKTGDRIAQCILNKVENIEWKLVDELNKTTRGAGGFGHTGKQ
jgi:dUTP pyrophosphatase